MRPSRPAHACTSRASRRGWVLTWLLVAIPSACSRHIEEEPPIPEHRLAPCETWCSLMFDPVCPATDVAVKTEEECFDYCTAADHVWAPTGDEHDDCAATYIPYVDCMASLSCGEIQHHFASANVVSPEEQSSCGGLLQAQLDCQDSHD